MREILFRGKVAKGSLNGKKGEWVYGFYVYDKDFFNRGSPHRIYTGQPENYAMEYYRVEDTTVGQYTGLKDKNGKRIFEGDIVRYIYEPGKGFWNANQLSVIRYGKTGLKFDGIKGTNKYSLMCGCMSSIPFNQDAENIPEFEVIGNIHDNPELVEAANGKV